MAALLLIALTAEQRSAHAHHLCGSTGSPMGPFDMETYEAGDFRALYGQALELAGYNALFPEIPAFALDPLKTGPRSAGSNGTADAYIPPVLLKAIAHIESHWSMGPSSVPYGSVGAVLSSHDCGYGIMQVTTGMQNITGLPNIEQAMIGGHFGFNIARGARILAEKWNQAPQMRPIVGDRNPRIIEDWYYALWGYNGFAFSNHPLNPSYQTARVPYSCGPQGDGFGHNRSAYPYQELVLGCAARPPVSGGELLWEPQPSHLPDLSNPAFSEPLRIENWNPCVFNLNCAPMDIPRPNPNHRDRTGPSVNRAELFGFPRIAVSSSNVSLFSIPPAVTGQATITVSNSATGLLTFRATSSQPWLKLSRHQGVALGSDMGTRNSQVTLTADGAGLPPGIHTAQITIESLHANGSPHTVTVSLLNYPDGTLLQAPGTGVYVMRRGLKRAIPNAATFEAMGYNWGDIRILSPSVIAGIPTGNPLLNVLADGNLVKGSAASVYVMERGEKRPVSGPPVMDICRYRWTAVNTIPDSIVDGIQTGPPLGGPPCPKFSVPTGTLLQGTGPAVYMVQSGLRRHIPDPPTLAAAGLNWGNVNHVPDGILEQLPVGAPMLSVRDEGNLIRGSGPAFYVMHAGTKRHITSLGVMSACSYGGDSVRTIPDSTLNSIPTGPPLEGPPCPRLSLATGTLVQGSDAAIHVIDNGARRHIASLQVFGACNYRGGNVNRIANSQIAMLPAGEPLTGPPCP